MKLFALVLLCVVSVSLFACADKTQAAQPDSEQEPIAALPQQPAPPVRILALGDSLTEGLGLALDDAYPAQLERALKAKGYNVVVTNAGVSGETTAGLTSRIDWLTRSPADIVILCSGANDGLRGVPVEQTKENLRVTIETLQKTNATIIFAGMIAPQNNGAQYTEAFAAIYPELAEEYNLEFIPFFLKEVVGDESLNQQDQIHPTKEGYTKIVDFTLLPVVETVLLSQQ